MQADSSGGRAQPSVRRSASSEAQDERQPSSSQEAAFLLGSCHDWLPLQRHLLLPLSLLWCRHDQKTATASFCKALPVWHSQAQA